MCHELFKQMWTHTRLKVFIVGVLVSADARLGFLQGAMTTECDTNYENPRRCLVYM